MIEGVDYSRVPAAGPPGSAALKAAGKRFVVRYLAEDERGLTRPELAELTAGGIEVAVVYETTEEAWRGGSAAGMADAQNAQRLLLKLGLPASMPIYLTVDFDTTPEDQAVIDAYLGGAASILGAGRVGVYGSFYVVERCFANKTPSFFWQTSAWSGGQLSAHAHLYQYDYGLSIRGTDCDRTRALQPHYGQASDFVPKPPTYAKPGAITQESRTIAAYVRTLPLLIDAAPRSAAAPRARASGPTTPKGTVIDLAWLIWSHVTKSWWYADTASNRWPPDAFIA